MARRLPSLLLLLLLGGALVACGEDPESGPGAGETSGAGLDSVTIDGEVGSEPEVTWDGRLAVGEVEKQVVSEGDGARIDAGDQVLAHVWVGNGSLLEKAFSTYDAGAPQLLTVDAQQLSELFLSGVEGQTVGSRVAVAAPASVAFGPSGSPQIGIGNKDTVVTVIDLLSAVAEGPQGTARSAPAWAPELEGPAEAPTGLDFAGTPRPDGALHSAVLVEGEGAQVRRGQTIVVDYLGQVYGGRQPFDESYSAQPASFPIGVGSVVKGWDQTLVGTTVGSRLVIAIPPKLGYGEAGNEDAGIKGTDTLYFVVDVLAAG